MSKNYWFHSFKGVAWQEFHEQEVCEGDALVTGFPNSRWATVQKMQIGDCLLCYQAGESCWIGALEAVSIPFYLPDEEPLSRKEKIWHDVDFRSRVAVKVLISLSPKTGVPMSQLKDLLSINGPKPGSLNGHLRDHPRRWKEADAKIVLAALEERYAAIVRDNAVQNVRSLRLEDGDEDILKGYEGGKKPILVNHYERDPALRAEAIRIHGTTCKACGFDFAKVYGSHGQGYIDVHHLRLVSTLAEKTSVNPKEDMTVLCSNCHRMVHHRIQNILTLEQLVALIQKRSGDNQGN
jgi:HNH endonuclease